MTDLADQLRALTDSAAEPIGLKEVIDPLGTRGGGASSRSAAAPLRFEPNGVGGCHGRLHRGAAPGSCGSSRTVPTRLHPWPSARAPSTRRRPPTPPSRM